jgi:hypothetical protein
VALSRESAAPLGDLRPHGVIYAEGVKKAYKAARLPSPRVESIF